MNERRSERNREAIITNQYMSSLSDEELAKATGGSIIDEKCLCECKNCNAMTCCVDGSPCECGGTFRSVKK